MSRPVISVALIAYDMPRQAANTIRSLTLPYQRGVDESFFEVVVVENRSTRTIVLPDDLAPNVRYHLRDEPGVSPAAAINFGLARARGEFICLMIDGARMVTPGILQYAAMARRITDDALVVVPGYHLGSREQHLGAEGEDPEAAEQALLSGIRWPEDGYRLFEVACWSAANRFGVFHPFMESNCLFASRRNWDRVGGADERFQLAGGGALNLALYRRLALLPETVLFVLPGEGSFHQVHGGVTTTPSGDHEERMERQRRELDELLGEPFRAPRIAPILLGTVTGNALEFLKESSEHGRRRDARFTGRGWSPYDDERGKIRLRNCGPDRPPGAD